MRFKRLSAAFAVLVVTIPSVASALTATVWKGSDGGDWNEPNNWTAGVPTSDVVADFSTVDVNAKYTVSAGASDIFAGGFSFGACLDFVLSGTGKVTLSRTDADPEISVAAGGTAMIKGKMYGPRNLVKKGAGTFGANYQAFLFDGRTVVESGVLQAFTDGTAGSYPLGKDVVNGLLVKAGGTFRLAADDRLSSDMPIVLDGGILDLNAKQQYIGMITLKNGAHVIRGTGRVLSYDAVIGHLRAEGGGFAGRIEANWAVANQWGKCAGIYSRTQEVYVAENTTLEMKVNLAEDNAFADYRGTLNKTGLGDLVLEAGSGYGSPLRGSVTAADGRIVFTNETVLTHATLRVDDATMASRYAFAPSASLTVGAISMPKGVVLDLDGATLCLTGLASNPGEMKGEIDNGIYKKTDGGDLTVRRPLGKNMQGVIVGSGSVNLKEGFEGAPEVHWSFNDPEDRGADLGSLGKRLDIPGDKVYGKDDELRGGCLWFDAGSAPLKVPADGLPSDGGAFTVAAWMRSAAWSSGLFQLGSNDNGKCAGFGIQNGTPKFYFWGRGECTGPFSAEYSKGTEWHHFACVYDPAAASDRRITLYVDGEEASHASLSGAVNIDSVDMELGGCTGSSDRYMRGGIDEFMVFKRALSADDVLVAMRADGERKFVENLIPPAADVSIEDHAVIDVGIKKQVFSSLSGDGTIVVEKDSEVEFAVEEGEGSVGGVVGGGTAVKTGSGTLFVHNAKSLPSVVEVRDGNLSVASDFRSTVRAQWNFDDPEAPGEDSSGNGLTLVPTRGDWAGMTNVAGKVRFQSGVTDTLSLSSDSDISRLPHGNEAFTVYMRVSADTGISKDAGLYSWGVCETRKCNAFALNDVKSGDAWDYKLVHYMWGDDLRVWPGAWRSDAATPVYRQFALTYDPKTRTSVVWADGSKGPNKLGSCVRGADLNVLATDFRLGCAANTFSQGDLKYSGWMDEFAVYACTATEADVASLFAEGLEGIPDGVSCACSVAEGAEFEVASGLVCVGSFAATGMVSVAEGAVLRIAGGTAEFRSGVQGVGAVEIAGDGTLFAANGPLSMPRLNLLEGAAISVEMTDGVTSFLTSAAPVVLPESWNLHVDASRLTERTTATLLRAPSISGSVDQWTLVVDGLDKDWKFTVLQTTDSVILKAKNPSGLAVIVR